MTRFARPAIFQLPLAILLVGGVAVLAESAVERLRTATERLVLREVAVDQMPLAELLTDELPRLIRRDAPENGVVQLVYLPAREHSSKDQLVTLHLRDVSLDDLLRMLCWQCRLRMRVTANAVVLLDAALGLPPETSLRVYPIEAGALDTRRTRRRRPPLAGTTVE